MEIPSAPRGRRAGRTDLVRANADRGKVTLGNRTLTKGIRSGERPLRSGNHFPPVRTASAPGVGEDHRRCTTWALLDLRPTFRAAYLGFYFPEVAVGTYINVAAREPPGVAIPPVPFNSHPVTVTISGREVCTDLSGVRGQLGHSGSLPTGLWTYGRHPGHPNRPPARHRRRAGRSRTPSDLGHGGVD